jgi:hypothetical protein
MARTLSTPDDQPVVGSPTCTYTRCCRRRRRRNANAKPTQLAAMAMAPVRGAPHATAPSAAEDMR